MPTGANTIPHVPLLHVLDAQTVSVPGQSDGVTHWTHAPAPLQMVPPPLLQVVPAAEFVQDGTPLVHVAFVHGAHVGRFVLSTAMPQTPLMHVAFLHEPAPGCGHWEADVHWLVTHVPAPSQVPPVHGLPAGLFVKPHVPATQVAVRHEPGGACGHVAAVVHWLVTQVPEPSHVPPVQGLPAALLENPQVPFTQTAVWHEPGAACGHVAAVVHPPLPVLVHVPLKHAPFTQISPAQHPAFVAHGALTAPHVVVHVPVKHAPSRQT